MMAHAGSARREQRHGRAALALQAQLRIVDGSAELVVADLKFVDRRSLLGIVDRCDLALAPVEQRLGLGGVVAVTVDDWNTGPTGDALRSFQRFDIGRR